MLKLSILLATLSQLNAQAVLNISSFVCEPPESCTVSAGCGTNEKIQPLTVNLLVISNPIALVETSVSVSSGDGTELLTESDIVLIALQAASVGDIVPVTFSPVVDEDIFEFIADVFYGIDAAFFNLSAIVVCPPIDTTSLTTTSLSTTSLSTTSLSTTSLTTSTTPTTTTTTTTKKKRKRRKHYKKHGKGGKGSKKGSGGGKGTSSSSSDSSSDSGSSDDNKGKGNKKGGKKGGSKKNSKKSGKKGGEKDDSSSDSSSSDSSSSDSSSMRISNANGNLNPESAKIYRENIYMITSGVILAVIIGVIIFACFFIRKIKGKKSEKTLESAVNYVDNY